MFTKSIFRTLKEPTSKGFRSNQFYIGETLQYLQKRTYQHFCHIKNKNPLYFGLVLQSIAKLHHFDFQNMEILHNCYNHYKSEVSEPKHMG